YLILCTSSLFVFIILGSSSSFFYDFTGFPSDLHSFPTRRSSDLIFARGSTPERRFVDKLVKFPSYPQVGCHTDATTRRSVTIGRSEEHTSELQSRFDLVCRLLLEKKKISKTYNK